MAAEGIHDDLDPAVPFAAHAAPVVADTLSVPEGDFKVGDKAVYRGLGVVEVMVIEESDMARSYVLVGSKRKITVSVIEGEASGLRPLVSELAIREVFEILGNPTLFCDKPWHRYIEVLRAKLATGSIHNVAEVFGDLSRRKTIKRLSVVEQKIFNRAQELLIGELAVVRGLAEVQVKDEIEAILSGAGPAAICAAVKVGIAESGKASLIANLKARPQAVNILIITHRIKQPGNLNGLINGMRGAVEEIGILIEEGLLEKLPGEDNGKDEYKLTAEAEEVIDYLR